MRDRPDILPFLGPKLPTYEATVWQRLKSRLRVGLGTVLRRAPGLVRPVEIRDDLTGRTITVQVGTLYTRVTIDGRDYYFNRFTGRYDGTGSGCGC